MEENTHLPKEVVESLKAAVKRRSLSKDYADGYKEGYIAGATAYATKLHQANETIKVLEYDNNRLKGEVEGLQEAVDKLKAQPGARWLKASDKRPEGWQLVRFVNATKRFPARFAPHVIADMTGKTYEPQELEYLSDESAAGRDEDWIDVNDSLPEESGRYWCYVESLTDLGFSYFQWNCDYNSQLKRFSDMTLKNGERVTHWRKLPEPPKRKQQKEK